MGMKKLFLTCLGLSLAGTLVWADLSWGQRRDGTGPYCPANPNAGAVNRPQGQGVAGCPLYTGNYGQGQSQGWGRGRGRGFRGQGRGRQGGFGQNASAPTATPLQQNVK